MGLSGNWAELIGAVGLIVTLVANPDGVAGTAYWKRRSKAQAKALATAAQVTAGTTSVPEPRAEAPSTATSSVDQP